MLGAMASDPSHRPRFDVGSIAFRSCSLGRSHRKEIVPMKTRVKASFVGTALALALVASAYTADFHPVNDGNDHGDPPFLLEDGWKPLLNGKNLDGWTYVDTRRDGAWMATQG